MTLTPFQQYHTPDLRHDVDTGRKDMESKAWKEKSGMLVWRYENKRKTKGLWEGLVRGRQELGRNLS